MRHEMTFAFENRTPEARLVSNIIKTCFKPMPIEVKRVLRRGLTRAAQGKMTFKPWLVTRDGVVVGEVPDGVDKTLMQLHRFHKELKDVESRSGEAAAT
jgi:hypothetical protein